jgi:hypothetical protein
MKQGKQATLERTELLFQIWKSSETSHANWHSLQITWLYVLHPYCSIWTGETAEAVCPCHQLLGFHSYIPLSDM